MKLKNIYITDDHEKQAMKMAREHMKGLPKLQRHSLAAAIRYCIETAPKSTEPCKPSSSPR